MSNYMPHKYLEHLLQNCSQMNNTRPHWWLVNIGSGSSFGAIIQLAIIWINFDQILWRHMASLYNELSGSLLFFIRYSVHLPQLIEAEWLICVSKLTIIGSDNGLSPIRRQAIIWTNAGIFLIRNLGTNFSKILSEIHTFSLKKMHLKMLFGKWEQFCLGLNVLKQNLGWVQNLH